MNRWLMIGSLAALLVTTTGCLHHNLRNDCSSGDCKTAGGGCKAVGCLSGLCGNGGSDCGGTCDTCAAGPGAYGVPGHCIGNGCAGGCGSGMLGRMAGMCGLCGKAGCRHGCIPGRLGWQQGGHDYSAYLQPGCIGHDAADALNSRPFTPGPPTAQVGYPYYTIRGPRDFLVDNPPTIGR